ncbi:DMT family transporter [Falsirhodobacter halotolerans]|uniref:DMT family transporter n=1 Tax=Falsirhodobacter halotolerans TaxID=1146892 RepID=UPI001FD3AD83|nr:DMT family transporter [Falsirhodobacter halotolerans]MCJ8141238.1 DMT family transporter [Falsirhodobacter halotolerans]
MWWIPVTLIAAAAQTGRNAAQRGLTAQIGTMGATAVRFVFGLPFALAALALWAIWHPIPMPGSEAMGWFLMGSVAQIAATALMLVTMQSRSFGVTTALLKTEPVTVALIGAVLLGDRLSGPMLLAIATATAGVMLMSGLHWRGGAWRAAVLGVVSGGLFGLTAIGVRGGVLALPFGSEVTRAVTALVITQTLQTVIILLWLALRDRTALRGMMRLWRSSLGAGFLGAFASLFWFTGFAMTSAANVRTLGLVEVVMAQIVSGRVLREGVTRRQIAGMALVLGGVAALIAVAV